MVQTDLYKKAIGTWGKAHQLGVAVEEMAEAIVAITQMLNRDRDVEAQVIDELADVSIMIAQCQIIYGDRLTQAIHKKLKKLKGHIDEHQSV